MGIIAWIVVGLIAGWPAWLAGKVMKGGGYGVTWSSRFARFLPSWLVPEAELSFSEKATSVQGSPSLQLRGAPFLVSLCEKWAFCPFFRSRPSLYL
jgi:hypothetical protein